MVFDQYGDKNVSVAAASDDNKSPLSPSGVERAVMQEFIPPSIQETTGSVATEVTMRQVAPLVLVLTGATFLTTISSQAVLIILPSISRDLDIPETRQQWIVSAYAFTSAAFLLLCGKLADVYGKRLLFILGCFWITATTLGAAFSPVEVCMYVMRALQGLGAAITVPTAIGIIGHTIPPGRVKNYSFAFYSGGAPIGQVMGNLLGGIISEYSNWKVVLLAIAGAAFIAGTTAIFVIPKEPSRKDSDSNLSNASNVDWIGAFFFTSGLLILLIALSEGVSIGWDTPLVITTIIISLLFLAIFIFWQYHLEQKSQPGREPLMRISVFKTGQFSSAMIIVCLFSAGFTNFLVYSTYFYQDYQLQSPLQTTLRYIPLGVVGICSTIGSGYLLDRIRGNYILIFGLGSATLANLLFAVPIPPTTSYFAYGFPAMCLASFGADTVYPCLGLFTTQSLPRKDQGVAGAMFQTVGGIGRSMFLPITSTIQSAAQTKLQNSGATKSHAFLEGLRAAEWFCVACMGVSLLVTVVGLRNVGKIGLLKKLGNVQSASKEKDEEA